MSENRKLQALTLGDVTHPTWSAFTANAAEFLLHNNSLETFLSPEEAQRLQEIDAQEGAELETFRFQVERFTFRIEPQPVLNSKCTDADGNGFVKIMMDYRVDNPHMSSVPLEEASLVAGLLNLGCAYMTAIRDNFERLGVPIYYCFETRKERQQAESKQRNQERAEVLVTMVLQKNRRLAKDAIVEVEDLNLDLGLYSVYRKPTPNARKNVLYHVTKTSERCTVRRAV